MGGGTHGTLQPTPPHPSEPTPYRPTRSSSRSLARGRSRLQMSMVNSVLLLLKMDVREDMSAAIITAIMSPRRPAGGRGLAGTLAWPGLSACHALLS